MTNNYSDLVSRILNEPDPDAQYLLISSLHSLCCHGEAIGELRSLLTSPEERSVDIGLFIAEELGSRATPVIELMGPLLIGENNWFRRGACNVILNCSRDGHGDLIATCIKFVERSQENARSLGLNFISRANDETLNAGLESLRTKDQHSALAIQVQRLLASHSGAAIDSGFTPMGVSGIDRVFGVAEPARRVIKVSRIRRRGSHPVAHEDVQLLHRWAECSDVTVNEFADFILKTYCQRVAAPLPPKQ